LGRKLQSLSLENLSGRPKPTEVDPDINSFFQTLQKNIDRVSKDLQEQKKSMSPEEIQKIEKKFQEFKKLLEVGYLEEDTAQKKSTFWTRLVSIFK
jgi:murein L,D-transpeptidase YafK